jgi:FAD-linked sulfhydryl oxidase
MHFPGAKEGPNQKKDDCGVCTDFQDWMHHQKATQESTHKKQNQQTDTKNNNKMSDTTTNNNSSTSNNAENKLKEVEEKYYNQCPLYRNQLGNNTWSYLHTMAAYYPANPTDEEKTSMKSFIKIFAHFFPCNHCASDFRKE